MDRAVAADSHGADRARGHRPAPRPAAVLACVLRRLIVNALLPLIENELRRPPPAAVAQLAQSLAARAAGRAISVLYYGSALRSGELDGMLDFYVLLDDVGAWPATRLATIANRLLPPNVGYVAQSIDGRTLRAKFAVLSLAQFCRRVSGSSLDTTLWARFSQPCACVWARSAADRAAAGAAVCAATLTAARWAAWLGPECATAPEYWRALYARTYGAELRVESSRRVEELIDADAERYSKLLPAAWDAARIEYRIDADGRLAPRIERRERRQAARRWARRRRLGKLLNLLRLLKSAFTFDGAMDYVAWKVERHSGVRLEIRPWQRRHPLLAAPGLYWRLRRRGLLR